MTSSVVGCPSTTSVFSRELKNGFDRSVANEILHQLSMLSMRSSTSEEQPENAFAPMLVTLDGIVTLVRPLQPENAFAPMLVTLDGIVTDVSLLQPENAKAPMLVTR